MIVWILLLIYDHYNVILYFKNVAHTVQFLKLLGL